MATRTFGSRVVVVDPRGHVLLEKVRNTESGQCWWAPLGGMVMAGETGPGAAARHLREQLGGSPATPEGPAWIDEHWFRRGADLVHQQDRIFLHRAGATLEPIDLREAPPDQVIDHRWWDVEELKVTTEALYPDRLGELLPGLLAEGSPQRPVWLRKPWTRKAGGLGPDPPN